MRPLTHLGLGMESEDYELFSIDQTLYDILYERGQKLLEYAKKDFMGVYYNNPPVFTKKELEDNLEHQLKRLNRLKDLEAPQVIIEDTETTITNIYRCIEKKEYGNMNDPAYKSYRKSYNDRERSWEKSDERQKTIEEIQKYNEEQWEKVKKMNAK